MGRQAPGKKMPGIRNGPGGKCEEGESPLDCAIREAREEFGLELTKGELKYVGLLVEGEKEVYFYTAQLPLKVAVADNDEMIDIKWFDVEDIDAYISEMLPGNEPIMRSVARSLASPGGYQPFSFDFSNNQELKEATKNIFKT